MHWMEVLYMHHKSNWTIYFEDLKNSLKNIGFYLAVFIMTIILMRTVVGFAKMPGTVTVLDICSLPMTMSGFTIFSATFPSWAYAAQFYKEEKNHYDYFIVSRMSWKKYGIMRIISVSVSGGMILSVPLSIVFSFAYLVGKRELGDAFGGMYVRTVIQNIGIPLTLCIKTGLGFLFGSFWALFGLFSSFFLKNRFGPYLVPFIFSQFFWIIFQNFPVFNPNLLVRGEDIDSYLLSGIILAMYNLIIAFACFFAFARRGKQ